jgi:hypothetical protein
MSQNLPLSAAPQEPTDTNLVILARKRAPAFRDISPPSRAFMLLTSNLQLRVV